MQSEKQEFKSQGEHDQELGEAGKLHPSGPSVESLVSRVTSHQPTERPWRIKDSSSPMPAHRVRILGADGESVATAGAYRDTGESEANAELIVRCVNLFPSMVAALEKINMLACYASEENTDAREGALLEMGTTDRSALALATSGNCRCICHPDNLKKRVPSCVQCGCPNPLFNGAAQRSGAGSRGLKP